MKPRKVLARLLGGSHNVSFSDMRGLVEAYGFRLSRIVEAYGFRLSRINGSHHIFTHLGLPELVNLQEVVGQAKPYQIRQFLKLVEEYNLKLEEERP